MDSVKKILLPISLGLVFAYLSITVIGYGAAVAIPTSISQPLAELFPFFAFALIDLVTIGVPLAVVFLLFVLLTRFLIAEKGKSSIILLAMPFFVFHLYLFFMTLPANELAFYLATTLPKYILLAAIVWYLSHKRQAKLA